MSEKDIQAKVEALRRDLERAGLDFSGASVKDRLLIALTQNAEDSYHRGLSASVLSNLLNLYQYADEFISLDAEQRENFTRDIRRALDILRGKKPDTGEITEFAPGVVPPISIEAPVAPLGADALRFPSRLLQGGPSPLSGPGSDTWQTDGTGGFATCGACKQRMMIGHAHHLGHNFVECPCERGQFRWESIMNVRDQITEWILVWHARSG